MSENDFNWGASADFWGHLSQLDRPHSARLMIGMEKVTVMALFDKVFHILH